MDFAEALKIALADVGYNNLGGEAMFKAYQKLTGFKRQGVTGPNACSSTSRRGSQEIKFYRVKKARVVPITDWMEAPDAVSLYKW